MLVAVEPPSFCAVLDDESAAAFSVDFGALALPGDFFTIALILPSFVVTYVKYQAFIGKLPGYRFVSQERPPPLFV